MVMEDFQFTEEDIRSIEAEGLTREQVLGQMKCFRRGSFAVRLRRACTVNDGIVVLSEDERKECVRISEDAARNGRMMAFVPASGAASRMFQDWIRVRQERRFRSEEEEIRFREEIRKYAFFGDLREALRRGGLDIDVLMSGNRWEEIFDYLLTSRGLHYTSLPKALITFHAYGDGNRTALEEHLVEAVLCVRDRNGICRIHFTVSEDHEQRVRAHIAGIKGACEDRQRTAFQVEISTQRASTNTIALDLGNRPFRNREGRLVFRPGGHGALLENLNELNGDIVMVKNIDNIVPDRLKLPTVFYRKILGGYLLTLQGESFRYLEAFSAGGSTAALLSEAERFCRDKLFVVFPPDFDARSKDEKRTFLFEKLNRPLRVCGMVKNEGEPGGGPFWAGDKEGETLQIVEEAQIDAGSEDQTSIWRASTHFNPVDMVCGLRDFRSEKFNLKDYVDEESYIISRKFQDGSEMKALERPGLWNGSMARWNTVFVEVPIETFNPVKTVRDLLRPQHLTDEGTKG
jgi:hypothetical protein